MVTDGTNNITEYNNTIIQNYPPFVVAAFNSTGTVNILNDLSVNVLGWFDVDTQDPQLLTVEWFLDNVLNSSLTTEINLADTNQITLGHGNFTYVHTIEALLIPSDGEETGNSVILTITVSNVQYFNGFFGQNMNFIGYDGVFIANLTNHDNPAIQMNATLMVEWTHDLDYK